MISCSSDDSTVPDQDEVTEFPTNITLAEQTINIGEILTINGTGFSTNETYVVTFTGNVPGTINEINPNFLKIEVPQNAQSGEITLRFNNTTEVIGNLVIEDNNTSTEEVYIYQESVGALAKLNIETGSITYVGGDLVPNGTFAGAIYHPQNNEYIVFRNNTDPNFARVNLTTGNITYEVIDPSAIVGDGSDVFSAPIVDDNGNVYIYHESAGSLARLDIETGGITYVTDDILGGTIAGAIYHPQNNEYVIFENNTDPNYARINLTTGSRIYEAIDPSVIAGDGTDVFSDPVIDENGDVYIYHKSSNLLAKLDIETGGITYVTDGLLSGTIAGAIYHSQNNEYIMFENNTDPNYVRVNLTTTNRVYEVIDPSQVFGDGTDIFSGPVSAVSQ